MLAAIGVILIDPLLDLHWQEIADRFAAEMERVDNLRKAFSCTMIDVPDDVYSRLHALVRSEDDIGAPVEGLSSSLGTIGFSPAFFISVAVVAAAQVVLSRTVFGRELVAIGTNEQAVRLAGINPRPAKIAVYALVGLLAGLGAVFYTSRLGAADPNAGYGLELAAIAAVVIGGTSLMGGRGSVVNSFFGVLIIATLQAGLAQVGASEPTKRVVTGAVIVIAVIVDAWRHQITRQKLSLLRRWLRRPA